MTDLTPSLAAAHAAYAAAPDAEPVAALNAALVAFAEDLARRGYLHAGPPPPPAFDSPMAAAMWMVDAAGNPRVTGLGPEALLGGPGTYEHAATCIRERGSELGPDTPALLRAAIAVIRDAPQDVPATPQAPGGLR